MNGASAKDSDCSQTAALSFPTKWEEEKALLGLLLCQRKRPFLIQVLTGAMATAGLEDLERLSREPQTCSSVGQEIVGGADFQCLSGVYKWENCKLLIADNVRRVQIRA